MMLQRPSIKLPARRLSQLTKTPTKQNKLTANNENQNHLNTESNDITDIIIDDDDDDEYEQDERDSAESTEFVTSHMKNTENIQCMVRIRPIIRETEGAGRLCVDLNSKTNMITIDCKPKQKSFTFDHVGGLQSTQESIFQVVGKPITNACLSGYNGTIFAYGQTGSGKTFTILGDFEDKNSSKRGLMPRVFDYLFSQIQRHRDKMGMDRVEYLVKCSCLEIYNERIQDLLEPNRCNLQIREDIKRGVIVEGLSYKICETANHALDLITTATRNRRVSATSMNKESSRSHLMFSLLVECRITDHKNCNAQDEDHCDDITKTPAFTTRTRSRSAVQSKNNLVRTRTSRFNLVDLAGSERQSKTQATGDRLREAGNINKSLTVLGHVMKALVQQNMDNNGKHRHIHYRDSKLTHLLKDSLGGNSLTFMIACISPSSLNLLESLSTLQFASRAKYIKNKAQLNEDQSGSIQVLKMENLKLINQVAKLRTVIRKQRNNHSDTMQVDDDKRNENNEIKDKKLAALKDSVEILQGENYSTRRETEKLKTEISELNNVIDKKQSFVMNLKMQLKLREKEAINLRNAIDEKNDIDVEKLRNEIIQRYEREEKERKMLLSDPSYLAEEHCKNLELQQQCQQMMDFIHRFVDEENNKFRNEQYLKWKNLYQVLVDENEELRLEIRSNEKDSLKLLAVKQQMVQPKIDEYKQQIDALQQEIGGLQNKKQLEESKYLMEKEAMRCEYEKQLENMRQGAVRALDSNNEQSMQLKMDITQLSAKLAATEKALAENQAQHRETKKAVETMTIDAEDQKNEIVSLQDALCAKDETISKLRDEMRAMSEIMENKIGEKHSNITRLEAEVETMSQQFADLRLQYESLQDDHQILNDVHSTLEYQKGEMSEKISKYLDEIQSLNVNKNGLIEEIQDKKTLIQNLQNEVSEKMQNKDEMVRNLNAKNEDLLANYEEIKMEMNSMKETLNESQNEMLRKDIDIEALRREISTINGQLSDYKSAHHELETKYSAHLEKYADVEHTLSETQIQCDSYNTALIEKNIKLQQLLEDNESLQNESDCFQEESARNLKTLNDEIESREKEISKKEEIISKISSEMATLKNTMNETIGELKKELVDNENEWKQKLSEKETEFAELKENLMNVDANKNKIENEYVLIEKKYANEKCKLEEKEQTLSLLREQLSKFKWNVAANNVAAADDEIESEMAAVFEQFKKEQNELNEKITQLTAEKEASESKLAEVISQNESAKETFEAHKKNMVEQLARAHKDVEQRQNRSERLIKTFEQRLELRQKQNVEYREKMDELTATITAKMSVIKKHNAEMAQLKDQLVRCQHTVSNAQSLNETLLKEKAAFDEKLEARDAEIEEITMKHGKLQQDLTRSMEQRMAAIKTSKRMRSAEEKAFNEMLEWKTKYNDLEETSQRIRKEMDDLKTQNEKLAVENSKLAGHHNAQQRINHLLNLKRECEKLKREKKQYLNKISALQKKCGMSSNNLSTLNLSICSSATEKESATELKEQLLQMSASKDEMAQIISKILATIKNISQLSVVEENINFRVNTNNVEQHLFVLNTIQNVIHDQNNQIIKLKRDIDGLANDINIRNEQIKLLQDQMVVLSPAAPHDKKKKRKRSSKSSKRQSTDNFNFD